MGITFLTPIDAVFALAAAVPLAALWLAHSQMERVRRLFSLRSPRRRELAGVVGSLTLLPVLMGVAAAQPVVTRRHSLQERLGVQAFFVFDTSRSMTAQTGLRGPTRLQRARHEAEEVLPKLGDIPVGIASMTDRVLPDLMPTSNLALIRRTIAQSVGINRPPPSALYVGRATTFAALYPIANSNFFNPGVGNRILVVFTDGEATPFEPGVDYDRAATFGTEVHPLFVHVWAQTERIYVHGHVDPRYTPDPTSAGALSRFAAASKGRVFGENDLHALELAIRQQASSSHLTTNVSGYARVALAPWFVLAGVIPLAFLLYRRNL